MIFESERGDMTDVADHAIRNDLGYDHTVQEFPHGVSNCRTDIVGVNINTDALERRESLFGHKESLAQSRDVLETYSAIAAEGPITRAELESHDGLRSKLRIKWDWLADRGFIEIKDGMAFAVPIPIHVTAHAFELKREMTGSTLNQVKKAADRNVQGGLIYGYATEHSLIVDGDDLDTAEECYQDHYWQHWINLFSAWEGGIRKEAAGWDRRVDRQSRDLLHLNEITYSGKEPLWAQPSFADTTFAGNGVSAT